MLATALAGLVPALAGVPLETEWTPLLVICLFLWGVLQSLAVTLLGTLLSECSERHRGTVIAFYSLATNLAVARTPCSGSSRTKQRSEVNMLGG
ncbi:hypothetical protein [Streptomyces huasconensis]|uniref:hypothetical protein n=1 Tax=Streptomyces huasconensis TaxID=1854574 RepID=UPI0036FE6112